MTRWLAGVAALALGIGSMPVDASTYVEVTTVCPVGGQSFTHSALASYTSFGALPDGMPIGTVDFPVPLAECPDNGLVLYRDFEEAEVPALARIVASPEYQAARGEEQSYYRAYRLAAELGDEAQWLGTLLQSAWWQAKTAGNAEQATRYGTAFVDWAAEQPAEDGTATAFMIQLRRVNALRELGRFTEAEAVRDAMPTLSPNADLPNGAREQLIGLAERFGPPIERNDASRSPIDLLPPREAAARCIAASDSSDDFAQSYCATPGMTDAIAGFRQMQADLKRLEDEADRDTKRQATD